MQFQFSPNIGVSTMRNNLSARNGRVGLPVILAAFVLAITLNACGGDDGDSGDSSSNSGTGKSSSSGESGQSSSSISICKSSGLAKASSCNIEDYRTVVIKGYTWMAENFNCEMEGSKCYNNESACCSIYGRLYDWETAMSVCPSGWHLPSNEEWDILVRYADGNTGTESPYDSRTAGKYLKAASGWDNGGNGQDTYEFSALPGGYGSSSGDFSNIGGSGYWWSSAAISSRNAYYRYINCNYEHVYWNGDDKSYLRSVRCVKN